MKKQLKWLPVVLLATSGIASASMYESCPFDGFYAGVGIGDSVSVGRVKSTSSVTASIAGVPTTASATSSRGLRKASVAGDIYAGYGWGWCDFYLGAEASFKFARNRTRNTDTFSLTPGAGAGTAALSYTRSVSVRGNTGEFDLDLRPGVLLTSSTLFYGRVGAAFNRLKVTATDTLSFGTASVSQTITHKKNKTGLRLGAGLEQIFCSNWAIRADYVWTGQKKINVSGTASNAFGTASTTANAKLSNHFMMLGLSYYW